MTQLKEILSYKFIQRIPIIRQFWEWRYGRASIAILIALLVPLNGILMINGKLPDWSGLFNFIFLVAALMVASLGKSNK